MTFADPAVFIAAGSAVLISILLALLLSRLLLTGLLSVMKGVRNRH
jgi:hypothetical protein